MSTEASASEFSGTEEVARRVDDGRSRSEIRTRKPPRRIWPVFGYTIVVAGSSDTPPDPAAAGIGPHDAVAGSAAGGALTPIPPSSSQKSRRWLGVVAVVAVAVIVVIAAIIVLGGIGPTSKPATSVDATSYAEALPTAEHALNTSGGRSWSLIVAIGESTTVGYNLSNFFGGGGLCPATHAQFSYLDVSGFNGSYTSGQVELWIFAFNSSEPSPVETEVWVYNGVAYVAGEVSGDCVSDIGYTFPSDTIDSTTAAAAAFKASWFTPMVRNVSTANVTYELNENRLSADGPLIPEWSIIADGCAAGGVAWMDSARINGLNGTFASPGPFAEYILHSLSCPTGGPDIASGLSLGTPTSGLCPSGYTFFTDGCAGADIIYRVPVESSTVDLGDLLIGLWNSSNDPYVMMGLGGISILNESGVVIAQYGQTNELDGAYPHEIDSATNASTPLVPGDVLEVDMGLTISVPAGLTLWIFGTQSFGGRVGVPLPGTPS
jgi:hypothetical protein